jgi:2-amino-4-hydroxy-6-hydroxymethyldihydropteridine diphosphokinase
MKIHLLDLIGYNRNTLCWGVSILKRCSRAPQWHCSPRRQYSNVCKGPLKRHDEVTRLKLLSQPTRNQSTAAYSSRCSHTFLNQCTSHEHGTMHTRNFSSYPRTENKNGPPTRPRATVRTNRAQMKYIVALGSNLGDRFDWIEKACREMEAAGICIIATSGLWQTKAMYVEDQNDFMNGVCLVETSNQPLELMRILQGIENKLGRVKVVDKGPRNIDLDILLWEHGRFHSTEPDLTVPHKLMEERNFVLAPLCQ